MRTRFLGKTSSFSAVDLAFLLVYPPFVTKKKAPDKSGAFFSHGQERV